MSFGNGMLSKYASILSVFEPELDAKIKIDKKKIPDYLFHFDL